MSFGPDESKRYIYLRCLLDAFQHRALDYCSSGESPQERLRRVGLIRDALTGYDIVPNEISMTPPCSGSEYDVGGACLPHLYYEEDIGYNPFEDIGNNP